MRSLFIVLGVIAAVIAVILSVLPVSNLAFIPAISALIFGLVAFYFSKANRQAKKTIQFIFLLTIIALSITTYKSVYSTSEVSIDATLQEKEEASEKDAIEELEGLEIEDLELDDINIEE